MAISGASCNNLDLVAQFRLIEPAAYATSPSRAGRTLKESARLPDRVFIKSGLKAGEAVIVGGTHKVTDGAAVTCKEAK